MVSINNFRVSCHLVAYTHDELVARTKTLTRFYHGENIRDEGLKRDMWDYYVHDDVILDNESKDDVDILTLAADRFFLQSEKIKDDINILEGRYCVYKKAIRDPEKLCIKYMLVLTASDIAPSVLKIKETHLNQTFKPSHAAIQREDWSGVLFRRSQANYFGIVREDLLGTPHAYTLHSAQLNSGLASVFQVFGDSIETVENWGQVSTLQSRVVLEREQSDRSESDILDKCDLIFVEDLRKTRQDIVNYIWGK